MRRWGALVGCSKSLPPCRTPRDGTGAPPAQGTPVSVCPPPHRDAQGQENRNRPGEKGDCAPAPRPRATSPPADTGLGAVPPNIDPPAAPGVGEGRAEPPPAPHAAPPVRRSSGWGCRGGGTRDPAAPQGPDSFLRFWKRRNLPWMASAAFSVSGALRSMSISSSSSSTFLGSPALAGGGHTQDGGCPGYSLAPPNSPRDTQGTPRVTAQGQGKGRVGPQIHGGVTPTMVRTQILDTPGTGTASGVPEGHRDRGGTSDRAPRGCSRRYWASSPSSCPPGASAAGGDSWWLRCGREGGARV